MNRAVVLTIVATLFGLGAVLLVPARRRALTWVIALVIVITAGTIPAVASFTANPSGHTHPSAGPLPLNSTSMPTVSLASPACTYTSNTALRVDWSALSSTYSWVGAVQPQKSTNGAAYSDFGSALAYNSSTVSDSGLTPASNAYTYRVQAKQGAGWATTSATASSATCADRISQLIPATGTAQIQQTDTVAVDSSGNVTMASQGNRVYYIPATSGTYFNISMTAGYMYVIAGTGTAGATGDAGAGTLAKVNGPEQVAFDSSGNVYVADTGSQDVRVISKLGGTYFGQTLTAGQIDRVAGSQASSGNTGDGAAARSAKLTTPKGVAIDSNGNLIISDTGDNRIRMVAASTCASSCAYGLASTTANFIYNIAGNSSATSGSSDATPATSGSFTSQQQIALDSSNNMYVADTGNRTVRKITYSSMALARFAGTTGSAGSAGDGGAPLSAQLSSTMSGVSVDASNNVYIADTANQVVRAVTPSGCTCVGRSMAANTINTVVGTGVSGYSGEGYPNLGTKLSGPSGVFYDRTGSTLYIADSTNYMIRKTSASNRLYNVAGTGSSGNLDSVFAGGPAVVQPAGLAVDSSGNVIFADKGDNRIREWIASTGEIATLAGTGLGGYTGDGSSALTAKVNAPEGVAVDSAGNVYIADTGNNKIRVISASATNILNVGFAAGGIDTVAGGSTTAGTCAAGTAGTAVACKLTGPKGVEVDSSGNLIIVDSGNNQILWEPNLNTYTTNATSYNNGSATQYAVYPVLTGLSGPTDVGVDSSRNVFLSDTGNNRIKKVTTAGTATTIAGNGSAGHCSSGSSATGACVNAPTGVAVDGTTVYFGNVAGAYVEKISGGNVTTIGGTGTTGNAGDGGGAIGAALTAVGVTEKAGGNVWVAGGTTTNTQLRQIIGPI